MNVLQNLTVFYNQLSPDSTYRNVCQGILENLDEVCDSTIYEVAELTNSSRTTIWRMVQKLGYKTFAEFHYELKQALQHYEHYNRILPVEECSTPSDIKNSLLRQMKSAYGIMDAEMDTAELENVADEIFHADKVKFYAPFYCSAIFSLQQNLARTGVETGYYCLKQEMIEDSELLTDKSVVFVNIIDYAETMDMTQVFDKIRKKGAVIIGVLNKVTRYDKYFDKIFLKSKGEGIAGEMMLFNMYFFALSEIYRHKYIDS